MDIIPEAIEDAKYNAKRMGFENTHYEAGTAEEIIPRWYQEGYRANAVIVDPPRTGLGTKLIETLLHYAPEKMVYVSCNVSTLARDLVALTKVYQVEYIQSVDMFPPYCKDGSSCEISEEVKNKNGYLGKTLSWGESSLCASRGFRFCLCSTCGRCCWGCRWSDLYGLCMEGTCGVFHLCAERAALFNMYQQSGQTKVKRIIAFRDKPPYVEGSGMPCGACREFLMS